MSTAVQVAQHLPYLRRFARALTGSQVDGDDQVQRLLEALLADQTRLSTDISVKLALYQAFVRTRREYRRDAGRRLPAAPRERSPRRKRGSRPCLPCREWLVLAQVKFQPRRHGAHPRTQRGRGPCSHR